MEIIEGIHNINGVRGANCYLVISGPKMLIIDTGMPGNGKKIINYIRRIGKDPVDIAYVVLTHGDIDHIGSAAEIKQMAGAGLAIHASDAPILAGRSGFKAIKGALGILFKLSEPFLHFHPAEPDCILDSDSEIRGLQVIHTPGHTKGSISLFSPGKFIFVGDALTRRFNMDTAQARASKIAISRLNFDVLLPGHGPPIVGKASARLKEQTELTD